MCVQSAVRVRAGASAYAGEGAPGGRMGGAGELAGEGRADGGRGHRESPPTAISDSTKSLRKL